VAAGSIQPGLEVVGDGEVWSVSRELGIRS
jgi:hypothetical protein